MPFFANAAPHSSCRPSTSSSPVSSTMVLSPLTLRRLSALTRTYPPMPLDRAPIILAYSTSSKPESSVLIGLSWSRTSRKAEGIIVKMGWDSSFRGSPARQYYPASSVKELSSPYVPRFRGVHGQARKLHSEKPSSVLFTFTLICR